jgi:hypothetical protein
MHTHVHTYTHRMDQLQSESISLLDHFSSLPDPLFENPRFSARRGASSNSDNNHYKHASDQTRNRTAAYSSAGNSSPHAKNAKSGGKGFEGGLDSYVNGRGSSSFRGKSEALAGHISSDLDTDEELVQEALQVTYACICVYICLSITCVFVCFVRVFMYT